MEKVVIWVILCVVEDVDDSVIMVVLMGVVLDMVIFFVFGVFVIGVIVVGVVMGVGLNVVCKMMKKEEK